MTRKIFISLPVSNLARSKVFYEAIGFTPNPQMSDDTAASMIWSDTIQLMLLTHEKWCEFTTRPLPAAGSSGVQLGLTLESRAAVDAINDAAAAHGGMADVNPVEDHGFMYGRDFSDPDDNIWGAMWMDETAA